MRKNCNENSILVCIGVEGQNDPPALLVRNTQHIHNLLSYSKVTPIEPQQSGDSGPRVFLSNDTALRNDNLLAHFTGRATYRLDGLDDTHALNDLT